MTRHPHLATLIPASTEHHLRRVNPLTYCPDGAYMHLLVEYLHRGRAFFKLKQYRISELNVHIPPPLRGVLTQVCGCFDADKPGILLGMQAVNGYENRIIISHPDYAIYQNEPMVLIELENGNNHPTYFEIT
jgi:hypothetical protein